MGSKNQRIVAAGDSTSQLARQTDLPFLMPVEDVFSITGRGTVATGHVERGVVKVGDVVEIIGYHETKSTTVTGVEMFRKLLDQAEAGVTSDFITWYFS